MKYIPDFIRVDFVRKAIALLFAMLVWWKISMQIGNEEIVRGIPVRIEENLSTVCTEEPVQRTVNMTVRTLSQRRGLLSPSDIRITIRLPQKSPEGEKFVEYDMLRDAEIQKPFGIKILSMDPDKIMLKIDRRNSRELPVVGRMTGSLSDDFANGEVVPSPSKVSVYGPESALRSLKQVHTEQIVLDTSIKESFEKLCRVETPNRGFRFVPDKVNVHVEVYRKNQRKVFKGLPVSTMAPYGASSSSRKMMPTNVDVTVSGPVSIIETMDGTAVTPFVKIEKDANGAELDCRVECHIASPEVKLVSVTPEIVKVTVAGER